MNPAGSLHERAARVAAGLEVLHLRLQQGQLGLRQGAVVAGFVIPQHGEGLAPVALAAEEPVAQLVVHLAGAVVLLFQPGDHLRLGLGHGEAVEVLGVDHRAVVAHEVAPGGAWVIRLHHLNDGQAEFLCKFVVAAVMCGHSHDGSRAVAGQHIVRNPHGYLLAVHGVGGIGTGKAAGLLLGQVRALQVALGGVGLPVGVHGFLLLRGGDGRHQLVLRGEHHVSGAEEGVRAGGVHGDGVLAAGEVYLGTPALADPVALQHLDALRPV